VTPVRYVFLAVFALHALRSVFFPRDVSGIKRKRDKPLLYFVEVPMYLLALYIGVTDGLISRELLSPLYIGLGLALGHLAFGLAILMVDNTVRDTLSYLADVKSFWGFAFQSPTVLTKFLHVAISEELIWRHAAWTSLAALTGAPLLAAGVIAVEFTVEHRNRFEGGVKWRAAAEFLVFSLLLGLLYWWTRSFVLVVVIHAIRDIEVTYLDFCEKYEECGDEEEALRETELANQWRRRPEKA
jgi:membrane protease YdiL (CAAX protease family)